MMPPRLKFWTASMLVDVFIVLQFYCFLWFSLTGRWFECKAVPHRQHPATKAVQQQTTAVQQQPTAVQQQPTAVQQLVTTAVLPAEAAVNDSLKLKYTIK